MKSDESLGVIAMLICRDAAAEIAFCQSAFDAKQLSRRDAPDSAVVHATLGIGSSLLMVHGEFATLASKAPANDGSSPVVIYVYVENVDKTIDRAVAAGAMIILEAKDQAWGQRVGRIIDPAGHVWNVAAPLK